MTNRYETGPRDLLIVEDERHVRDFYRRLLSRKYTIEEARNGREGFAFACANAYGLVITDVRMPDWDGIDLIVNLKLVAPNQKILVVGDLPSEIIREFEDCENVVGWIEKPVSPERLLKAVERGLVVAPVE